LDLPGFEVSTSSDIFTHVKVCVTPGLFSDLTLFLPSSLFINVDLPTLG
jgi:hypothetical protein